MGKKVVRRVFEIPEACTCCYFILARARIICPNRRRRRRRADTIVSKGSTRSKDFTRPNLKLITITIIIVVIVIISVVVVVQSQ